MFEKKYMEYLAYLFDLDLKTNGLAAHERVSEMQRAIFSLTETANKLKEELEKNNE